MQAYYAFDGANYVPSDLTRGPWRADHQHAGPPTALLARACARHGADPEMVVARMTVELLRPVPLSPLTVTSELVTAGRTTERVAATLRAGDTILARALSLRLRTQSVALVEGQGGDDVVRPLSPEASEPFAFDFFAWPVGYHTSIELRLASGTFGRGPVHMWMRPRVELVLGEPMAPLERTFVCADSASGVSQILDPRRWSFLNADLDVRLHRAPRGPWIGLEARTIVEPSGIGISESRIWDGDGPCGRGAQTLVVRPVVDKQSGSST